MLSRPTLIQKEI